MKKIFLGAFIASMYMPIALADTCEKPKLSGREGYDTVYCLNEEGLSMVTKPGNEKIPFLYGFVNRQGKVIVPLKYYVARDFSEGLAAVCKIVGKSDQILCGYINASGKEVIPLKFQDLPGDFEQGIAPVKQKGRWGFIDKNGKVVILFQYVKADSFSEGLAAVVTADTNKYGYINTKGEIVIPPKYEEAFYFNEGVAAVQILDKWGYIDKRNQWVIPARYKSASNFEDGMARVSQNDKYGYIDKKGKVVIPFKYEYLGSLSEGLIGAELNGKFGYLDKTGKVVIPFKFGTFNDFQNGVALVNMKNMFKDEDFSEDEFFYIDKQGKPVEVE